MTQPSERMTQLVEAVRLSAENDGYYKGRGWPVPERSESEQLLTAIAELEADRDTCKAALTHAKSYLTEGQRHANEGFVQLRDSGAFRRGRR